MLSQSASSGRNDGGFLLRDEEFKAALEAALAHGIDVNGRRIFLHGDVAEGSIATAIRGLYLLSDYDPSKPIDLYVSSYGGDLDEAFALHDVTRTIHADVHTCALGKCQSAAPIIVASGKRGQRWATESTTFMVHDAQMDFGAEESDYPANIIAGAEVTRAMMDRYAALMGRYTKKPKRFWTSIFKGKIDRFFDATEAETWGVIDGIWKEK